MCKTKIKDPQLCFQVNSDQVFEWLLGLLVEIPVYPHSVELNCLSPTVHVVQQCPT